MNALMMLMVDPITIAFSVIILSIFSFLAIRQWRERAPNKTGPNTLISLGILGTFTGIFVGLLGFDVENVDESIPDLLAGLQIAFFTSLLGMGCGLGLRLFYVIGPSSPQDGASDTPERIAATLAAIRDGIETGDRQQAEALARVQAALSGDADTSVASQITKLRTESRDQGEKLINEFTEFARTMAENNSKALIEALESVIRDFNTQLNEQFGENFQQLNLAVGALLEWQERYKTHVEIMEARIDAAVEALEETRTAIGEVADSSQAIAGNLERIPVALDRLEELYEGFRQQEQALKQTLEAFAELREAAVAGVPEVRNNLDAVTASARETIGNFAESLTNLIEQQQNTLSAGDAAFQDYAQRIEGMQEVVQTTSNDAAERLVAAVEKSMATIEEEQQNIVQHGKDAFTGYAQQLEDLKEQIANSITDSAGALERDLGQALESFEQSVEQVVRAQREAVAQSNQELQEHIRSAWTKTDEEIETRFDNFDQQMEQELRRALELMGSKLTSLSNKFVNDYTPLTEQLKQVVELAQSARNGSGRRS